MKYLLIALITNIAFADTVEFNNKTFSVKSLNQKSIISKLSHKLEFTNIGDSASPCDTHITEVKSIIKKYRKRNCSQESESAICEYYKERAIEKALGTTIYGDSNEPVIAKFLLRAKRSNFTQSEKDHFESKYKSSVFLSNFKDASFEDISFEFSTQSPYSELLEISGIEKDYSFNNQSEVLQTNNFATECIIRAQETKFEMTKTAYFSFLVSYPKLLIDKVKKDLNELDFFNRNVIKSTNNNILKLLLIGKKLSKFETKDHYHKLGVHSFYELFSKFFRVSNQNSNVQFREFGQLTTNSTPFPASQYDDFFNITFNGGNDE